MAEIPVLKGHFEFGTNVQVGYYAQSHEQLPATGTPLSVVLGAQPMGEESARTFLGRFLFSDDDVFKPIGALSGGERSRLALGLLLLKRANFLVLDEPTNHLDVSARESLEEMLSGFPGTLLFVSHDRYFIDKLATRLWIVEDGTVVQFLGNYSEYQRKKAGATTPQPAKPEPVKELPNPAAAIRPKDNRSESSVRKAIAHAEREISKLESRLNEVSDALTIAEVDQDFEKMAELSERFDTTQEQLELAYESWEKRQRRLAGARRAGSGFVTRPYLIGVTGNIACGKTAVMNALQALGATVIDGDLVYRDLTGPGSELVQELAAVFGNQIVDPDGSLNRPELGKIVFPDPTALAALDHLTHPAILDEVFRRIDDATTPVVATDGIKLIESGLGDRCDEIWVVTCTPERQRARLMARNGLTLEEADRRIAAQSPASEKVARADAVIANDGTLEDLRDRVRAAWMRSGAPTAAGRYLPDGYET